MNPNDYSFDSGDSMRSENLKEKISVMRSDLNMLKEKLYLEKSILNRSKQEVYGQNVLGLGNNMDSHSFEDARGSAITLNKTHLRDIERRCDKELKALNEYILNINELRTSWIKMRKAERLNSGNAENSKQGNAPEQKCYTKGKVFYVDNYLF